MARNLFQEYLDAAAALPTVAQEEAGKAQQRAATRKQEAAVYGDEPLPLSEASAAAPGSLHGAMHLARELAFKAELKAPLAVLRPTLIYGAADPHNGYGPNRFRRLANEGTDIVLFGEGEERRDHVAVDDVAELSHVLLVRIELTDQPFFLSPVEL